MKNWTQVLKGKRVVHDTTGVGFTHVGFTSVPRVQWLIIIYSQSREVKCFQFDSTKHRRFSLDTWVFSWNTGPRRDGLIKPLLRKMINFLLLDSYIECINHNAVLTLFIHTVQYLSQCQSAAAEFIMLKDLTAWTASIKPRWGRIASSFTSGRQISFCT